MWWHEQGKYSWNCRYSKNRTLLHGTRGAALANALKEVVLILLYVQNDNKKCQKGTAVIQAYYIAFLKHATLNYEKKI